MDWSWRCIKLANTITGSEPVRLPCVVLHESYDVCTQGELSTLQEALIRRLLFGCKVSAHMS